MASWYSYKTDTLKTQSIIVHNNQSDAVKQKSTREAWEYVYNVIPTIYGDAKVEAGSLHHLHFKRTGCWDNGIWRENRETGELRGCPSSYPSKYST